MQEVEKLERYKILTIKGVLLDKQQLENYLAKLASDNVLKSKSDKKTYPIPRVKENYEYITKVYNILTEHLKLGLPIHPAGEWLLDNRKNCKNNYKRYGIKKVCEFCGVRKWKL